MEQRSVTLDKCAGHKRATEQDPKSVRSGADSMTTIVFPPRLYSHQPPVKWLPFQPPIRWAIAHSHRLFGLSMFGSAYRFPGSERAYVAPSLTHLASSRLVRTSLASTRSHPFIVRPRISMG